MQTNHIEPLEVITNNRGDFIVVTRLGSPVGGRLLKGVVIPAIESWGPFERREDAVNLKVKLEKHFTKWPKKRVSGRNKK
jgi:hypothetical protein